MLGYSCRSSAIVWHGGRRMQAIASFLPRWVKRGLRDQADIYTAPLHRSEMKWVIGLPAVTSGLIAIDKHASGALPRNGYKREH